MKFPSCGKLRWKRNLGGLCLFALCWLGSSCIIEPLPSLLCYPCKKTCIEEQKLICVQGLCVPESNPNPKQCVGYYEGDEEKIEPTAEIPPEESANSEESATPEDGAPIEQEPTEQEPVREADPEKNLPESAVPLLVSVNGNGTTLPIKLPAIPPPDIPTKLQGTYAEKRIKDGLVLTGVLLDQITEWKLAPKDPQSSHPTLTWTNNDTVKGTNMITLPFSQTKMILTAGFFLLTGFSTLGNVQAQVFVLQGEKGDAGAKGDKGDKGEPGLTTNEQSQLQALLPKLKTSGTKLIITADEISFESTAGTEAGKMTIDSAKKELTFSTGTTIFSLTNTQITANSSQINLTTPTFEVKSTATNPTTSLKLDDTARSVSLRVTQKNATTQATFSLEGGDANTNPAPVTKYPLAIFNRTNVQVQSGAGSTNAAVNGLGNLLLGYNEARINPPADSGYARTGSHNLIIGSQNGYASFGGFVAGYQNVVVGDYASVAGGQNNRAFANYSSVSGGTANRAGDSTDKTKHPYAYVCGGNGDVSITSSGVSCTNVR